MRSGETANGMRASDGHVPITAPPAPGFAQEMEPEVVSVPDHWQAHASATATRLAANWLHGVEHASRESSQRAEDILRMRPGGR